MSTMTQYLKEVSTLECQLYSQKRLLEQLSVKANRLGLKKAFQQPTFQKVKTDEIYRKNENTVGILGFASFFLAVGIMLLLFRMFPEDLLDSMGIGTGLRWIMFLILPLILGVVCVWGPYGWWGYQKETSYRKKRHEERMAAYRMAIQQDESRVLQERKVKDSLTAQWNALKKEYDRTQSALTALYDLGIIHPKYQKNLVAVCSFYDYFDTGRCDRMTGPGGAYDTYENDLRFYRLETRLDVIIEKLDEIIDNQRYLGTLMQQANQTLSRIERKNDQMLRSMQAMEQNSELIAYNTRSAAQSAAVLEHIAVYRLLTDR